MSNTKSESRTAAELLRELEYILDVWSAPSPQEFTRLHRVVTGEDSCEAEAAAPTPATPLDVELERLARRLSDEFVAGDPEAGGLSSILQHAAREYRARPAPSAPTGEEEWTWVGDIPGEVHGRGDGWKHRHPNDGWWVHPEKVCAFAAQEDERP